jgi:hypothetical protein
VSTTCCGDHDIDFCRYAVIELDAELVRKLELRREMFLRAFKEDKELYTLEYWDYSARYYDESPLGEDFEEHVVDDGDFPELEPCRTECDILVVNERGFYWRAYPKHTSILVETSLIRWEEI